MTNRTTLLGALAVVLAACSGLVPPPPASSPAHLRPDQAPSAGPIPKVVEQAPFLPPPVAAPPTEKYTVVVHEVPVKELLFALARDAAVNVDVDPGIDGIVTLNAIDQALPQILDRIARQVDMRYEIRDKNLLVMPDRPYFRSYTVDYVNLSRDATGTINVATQIATTGAGEIGEGGRRGRRCREQQLDDGHHQHREQPLLAHAHAQHPGAGRRNRERQCPGPPRDRIRDPEPRGRPH
jgi:MSHA biogenesis protein MshL